MDYSEFTRQLHWQYRTLKFLTKWIIYVVQPILCDIIYQLSILDPQSSFWMSRCRGRREYVWWYKVQKVMIWHVHCTMCSEHIDPKTKSHRFVLWPRPIVSCGEVCETILSHSHSCDTRRDLHDYNERICSSYRESVPSRVTCRPDPTSTTFHSQSDSYSYCVTHQVRLLLQSHRQVKVTPNQNRKLWKGSWWEPLTIEHHPKTCALDFFLSWGYDDTESKS